MVISCAIKYRFSEQSDLKPPSQGRLPTGFNWKRLSLPCLERKTQTEPEKRAPSKRRFLCIRRF